MEFTTVSRFVTTATECTTVFALRVMNLVVTISHATVGTQVILQ